MNKYSETLEDLLCYLEGARDGLLVIHNVLEEDNINKAIVLSALYGTYSHLDLLAKEFQKHIEHIPSDVLRKAGEKAASGR